MHVFDFFSVRGVLAVAWGTFIWVFWGWEALILLCEVALGGREAFMLAWEVALAGRETFTLVREVALGGREAFTLAWEVALGGRETFTLVREVALGSREAFTLAWETPLAGLPDLSSCEVCVSRTGSGFSSSSGCSALGTSSSAGISLIGEYICNFPSNSSKLAPSHTHCDFRFSIKLM